MQRERIKILKVSIPYGKTVLEASIDDSRAVAVLTSDMSASSPAESQESIVEKALAEPIASLPLSELAKGKNNVVIIASDHTRPVPSKYLIPPMLREIRRGNPSAEITILVATGCHRAMTCEEISDKFGKDIAENENIVVHDCDASDNVKLGVLPSGGELIIDKLAADADLLVAEGFIEPHFFAGFSGGRKSVLPGIASRATVLANHCSEFVASAEARAGRLDENPIDRDMQWAAKRAGLVFVLNVILNAKHEIIYAVAGDTEKAHRVGCDHLLSRCGVRAREADIVITSNGGYPLDQNIYQAVKSMTAAEASVKRGGVIIACSECRDGHGGEAFYRFFKGERDNGRLMQSVLSTPRDATAVDQWQAQVLARVLMKARVIFVSEAPDDVVRDLHMIPAHSVNEAIGLADELLARRGTVTVIPDGVGVIVK